MVCSQYSIVILAAFTFGKEVVGMIGCNGTSDVTGCLRNKEVVDFFFKASQWPDPNTHITPPLAPSMPFGCVSACVLLF